MARDAEEQLRDAINEVLAAGPLREVDRVRLRGLAISLGISDRRAAAIYDEEQTARRVPQTRPRSSRRRPESESAEAAEPTPGPTIPEIVHPADLAALRALQAMPLLDRATRAFVKALPEAQFRNLALAEKIRLGPRQLPEYWAHVEAACAALAVERPPDLFLEMNPQPNAYTLGETHTFITITSGLLEHLSADEVRTVIAHEVGHIACRHMLYYTMAQLLTLAGESVLGALQAVSLPLQLALLAWRRKSELSADRAAAVATGEPMTVVNTMIRLAGGPVGITGRLDLDEYLRQVDDFDALSDSQWDRALQALLLLGQDHPFLTVRSKEILGWCETEAYQQAAVKAARRGR